MENFVQHASFIAVSNGDVRTLKTLALLNKFSYQTVSTYTMFIEWKKYLYNSTATIKRAGKLMMKYCGGSLRCAIPHLWNKKECTKIRVEEFIKFETSTQRYCLEYQDSSRRMVTKSFREERYNYNPNSDTENISVQHSAHSYWKSYTYKELKGNGLICSVQGPCECLHCKTHGHGPNRWCRCSRCSNPINGIKYVAKSTGW